MIPLQIHWSGWIYPVGVFFVVFIGGLVQPSPEKVESE